MELIIILKMVVMNGRLIKHKELKDFDNNNIKNIYVFYKNRFHYFFLFLISNFLLINLFLKIEKNIILLKNIVFFNYF